MLDDDTHQNLKTTGFVAREVHAKEEHDAGIQNLKVASFEAQVHDAETWALQVEKRMGQGGKDDVLDSVEVLDPAQGTWTPTPKLATRERRSPRPCWTAGSTSWGEKRLKEWLKWTRWQRRARMPSLQLNEPTSDPGAHGPEGPQRRSHRRSHRRRPPRRGRASSTATAGQAGGQGDCCREWKLGPLFWDAAFHGLDDAG